MGRKNNLLLLKNWVKENGTRNDIGYIITESIDDRRGVREDERGSGESKSKS